MLEWAFHISTIFYFYQYFSLIFYPNFWGFYRTTSVVFPLSGFHQPNWFSHIFYSPIWTFQIIFNFLFTQCLSKSPCKHSNLTFSRPILFPLLRSVDFGGSGACLCWWDAMNSFQGQPFAWRVLTTFPRWALRISRKYKACWIEVDIILSAGKSWGWLTALESNFLPLWKTKELNQLATGVEVFVERARGGRFAVKSDMK